MGAAMHHNLGRRSRKGVAASALAGTLLVAIVSVTLVNPSLAALRPHRAAEDTSSLRSTGVWEQLDRAGGRWEWDWSIAEEEAEEKELSYDSNGLTMPEEEVSRNIEPSSRAPAVNLQVGVTPLNTRCVCAFLNTRCGVLNPLC